MSAMPNSQVPRKDIDDRTELARRFVEGLVDGTAMDDRPTFDHTALQGLRVVEVAEGRIVCEMPVSERVQNRYGTLHGGAAATLVDTISTAALLTRSPHSGVSVHLAVTYLAPMPGGEEVVVDARVTRVGRQLASLEAQLRRKATGQLVATGTHTKFLQVADPTMAKMRAGMGLNNEEADSLRVVTSEAASMRGLRLSPEREAKMETNSLVASGMQRQSML
ncbi:hypothetical protein Vretimale_5594 [Volvox reticuliferus]|uniref:Acyl-coenzyme A thioesterase 13 n=2 Tax=Volvox reticuliferus TaxID=1737510 RepID=A0A8J4CBM2_9CHLO|nr:hypothetical protein Vretifemale_5618 [Volvox reticuliferus]GIM00620.1 hypothetical protein Vretimale_5594 [Volvox reticuliferus]